MHKQFSSIDFDNFIIENDVIGFLDKPIKLKSGQESSWYVNWRTCTSDVYLMDQVSNYLLAFIKQKQLAPDSIIGVPEGATKLGVISQYKWAQQQPNYGKHNYKLPMIRKIPKKHGVISDKFCVGFPQGKVILVEDVTTSGESLIETLLQLKEMQVEVIAAISLSNRMAKRDDNKSISEAILKLGVNFYSMSNAISLLPKAANKQKPCKKIAADIEKELLQYNTQQEKLF